MKNVLCSGAIAISMMATPQLLFSTSKAGRTLQEKPNVLFLFVDDLTFDGLNVLGNSDVISPNLDRLISTGVSFSNTYIMGGWNGAISIASRSQLITGRYLWNTRRAEKTKYEEEVANKEMWPQVMKKAGYKTFQTGKWHMTAVTAAQMFDKAVKVRGGMPADTKDAYNRPLGRDDTAWTPWDKSKGGYWSEGKHWSEILADETINYMEENKNSGEPLFMFCSFNAPHDPRQSPREYVDMYDVDKISLPENFMPVHPLCEQMRSGKGLRDERLAPFPRTSYAVRKHLQEYYALITHLDAQVGRILEALRKTGLDKNTLIVFAGDNGLSVGHHGLLGKQSMYDHSVKVPLAFCGLDLPKGEVRDQLVYLQDLVPTVYDLVGIEKPAHLDFVSQVDILKHPKKKSQRKVVYSAYLQSAQRMVTDGHYKLFFIPAAKKVYLFDLEKDPLEMKDLFGDAKYQKIVKRLLKGYLEEAEASGDTFDLPAVYPDLFEDVAGK